MAIERWAVIRDSDGTVENVCAWDGVTPWQPPAGRSVRLADEKAEPGGKWTATDGYTRPAPPPPDVPALARRVIALQAELDAATKLAADPGMDVEIARLTTAVAEARAALAAAKP
jgi:hypothetical protein